jgi:hypothetical protein
VSPATRRKGARYLLVLTLVAWFACRVAYALSWIGETTLDQITNDLSWFAIVLTAADILLTADVRSEMDEDSDSELTP